jgi:CheY-like chemotaxis protein
VNQHDLATVVVVDDEPPIVEFVCESLEDAGLRAHGCTQAAEAFWFIQCTQPTLAILDVQMPGIDGIELLQQMRARPETTDIPVIFLTANAHILNQHLPNNRAMGAQLLPKPFDLDKLITLVEQIIAP